MGKDWKVLTGDPDEVPTAVTMKSIRDLLAEAGAPDLLDTPAPVPRPERTPTAVLRTPPRVVAPPPEPEDIAPEAERDEPAHAPLPAARRGLVARLFHRG